MADIFLSYSSQDRERIRPLVQALESKGWSVWWDRKIQAGKTYDQVIEQALDEARCVVVVWSRHSVVSEWVKVEADEGANRKILIPVLIDEARIPLAYRRIQAARLIDWQGEASHPELGSLVESVEAIIGRPAISETQPVKEVIRQTLHLDEAPNPSEQTPEQKEELPLVIQITEETSPAEKPPIEEHRELPNQPAPAPFISPSHFVLPRETVEPVQPKNDRTSALPIAASAIEAEPVKFSSPEESGKDDRGAIHEPFAFLGLTLNLKESNKNDSVVTSLPILSRLPRSLKPWLAIGSAVIVIGLIIAVVWSVGGDVNKTLDLPQPLINFAEPFVDAEPEMLEIRGGTFMMGSPDNEPDHYSSEGPQHQVTVRPFALSKFEVTQGQWWAVAMLQKVKLFLNPVPSRFKDKDLPVEQVSWDEAVEFCARLSQKTGKTYRLPSEAEWEYACRAGTTGAYAGNLGAMAWYHINAGGKTHPVGQKQPNAFGLFDMQGNVMEWCEDIWHDSYGGKEGTPPSDGSAWVSGGDSGRRVSRGGSWGGGGWLCRSAYRFNSTAGYHNDTIGFRVVLSSRTR